MDIQQIWQPEPGGLISADMGQFRLVVRAPETDGYVRFLVVENRKSRDKLVASGTEDSVNAAKAAAERMATRFSN